MSETETLTLPPPYELDPAAAVRDVPDAGLHRLRGRLLAQAYLFDDPAAYAAGVEDALAAALA